MLSIIFIVGLVSIILIVNFRQSIRKKESAYFKVRKKLNDDFLQAEFLGDWRRKQEINLHLLWLEVLKDVYSKDMLGNKKSDNDEFVISDLSLSKIQFPLKWKLDDLFCFPFAQKILSEYGRVLAENDYEGMFKPDSILPVPKAYIRKAILFTLDFLTLDEPIYIVHDKDKRIENLKKVSMFLNLSFIDTGNIDLPKSGIENHRVGNSIKEKLTKHTELDDLSLIDWRTSGD